MQYAVQYRVAPAELPAERSRLEVVYAELVTEQPSWLSCASFLLDELGSMLLLIATDRVERLCDLPTLWTYLRALDKNCVGEPRAAALELSNLDTSAMTEVGAWRPAT